MLAVEDCKVSPLCSVGLLELTGSRVALKTCESESRCFEEKTIMSGVQRSGSDYHKCRLLLAVFLFCWLLNAACVASLSADGLALLEFKKAITDDPNGYFSDWDEADAVPCQWTGITCSGDEVTEINLSYGNFTGSLPESIGQIRSLVNISLVNNYLSGPIPSSIFNLTSLLSVDLHTNHFSGSIPSSFPSMSNLEYLDLSDNLLVGEIPESLANLKKLQELYLQGNQLTNIPFSFGTLDSVSMLDLSGNLLTGPIPPELGNMKSIQVLRLFNNQLTGSIPKELAKAAATMINLDLGNNSLSGPIPAEFGNLTRLLLLHLHLNMLNGSLPAGLFANMTVLEDVFLYENLFTGELPQELGLVQRFLKFDCSYNRFSGPIPPDFCKGGNQLQRLVLMDNDFGGSIPDSLGECPTLFRVRLSNNRLTGNIPKSFGKSQALEYIDLRNNSLTGPIPAELGNCSKLQTLIVSSNQLSGSVPSELSNLGELEASNNHLTGNLDSALCSKVMDTLDLSNNNLSGQLPLNLDICKSLDFLYLDHNQISGIIPPSVAFMEQLQVLDLSHNELTGSVPVVLSSSENLQILDVSYNNLEGPVSVTGFLATLNSTAFEGNPNLCGIGDERTVEQLLTPCTSPGAPKKSKNDDALIKGTPLILLIVSGVLTPFACWLAICFCIRSKLYKKYRTEKAAQDWSMIMFQKVPRLSLEDVLNALDDENVVGRGGSGKVYRGEVRAGKSFRGKTSTEEQPFVVKKLKTPVERGSGLFDHGFRAEVETLGNIRHYNVVKLLACCSNSETKLLVYEYMQNGSLADLLHGSKGGMLDWDARYKIALGAAQGLTYLHHDCLPPILHRDVSSSNILLDIDFNARLADFGLAKLVEETQKPNTVSILMGSHGYIAPECAFALKANEKTDVYSYGVVLLELVTGKRAVEGDTADGEHITMWTQWKIREKEGVIGALDPRLGEIPASAQEQMMMLLRIGLFCTSICPGERPGMREVVRMLIDVRNSSEIPMQGLDGQNKKKFRIVVDEKLPPINLPRPQLPDTPKSPPPLITL